MRWHQTADGRTAYDGYVAHLGGEAVVMALEHCVTHGPGHRNVPIVLDFFECSAEARNRRDPDCNLFRLT